MVTQGDSLYVIDANPNDGNTPCYAIEYLQLLPILNGITGTTHTAVPCSGIGSGGCPVDPVIGILGTPVVNISGSKGYIYLVTYSVDNNGAYYHYLHQIDIQKFQEAPNSPQRIAPPGSTSTQASNFSFEHIQRPGLLFDSDTGYVYVAFSMIDGYSAPYPNGTVFGFNTANLAATPLYFQTSAGVNNPDSNGGGIWQGGAAPAYGRDSTGSKYIYLKTANGTYDGSSNWGDSFLKLDPTTLTVPSGEYFTPADQIYRSNSQCTYSYQNGGTDPSPSPGDMDFGSGGVMLIPNTDLKTWPYLGVSGDKEGGIWFNDLTTPATPAHNSTCDNYSTLPQQCLCSATDGVVQAYWTTTPNYGQVIHNNPAFWQGNGNSYLYISTQDWGAQNLHGKLTRYALCAGTGATAPIGGCGDNLDAEDDTPTAVNFPYGVTPSISAASSTATDAVVWTVWGDGSTLGSSKVAVLYAFDASDTTGNGYMQELYQSTGSDAMTTDATKFSVPTVANGCVYIGTQGPSGGNGQSGMFYIFGISGACAE